MHQATLNIHSPCPTCVAIRHGGLADFSLSRAPSIILMSPTNLITRQRSDCCDCQDGREMSAENRFVFRCAADRVGVVAAFDLPNWPETRMQIVSCLLRR